MPGKAVETAVVGVDLVASLLGREKADHLYILACAVQIGTSSYLEGHSRGKDTACATKQAIEFIV